MQLRGEPRVCSMVRVPDEADEDARRCVRERSELISECVGLTNRIGAVLATLGVSDYNPFPRSSSGRIAVTPLLMVLIMITGDFLGMSLTTDNVRPSPMPNAWRIGNLTVAGVIMGLGELVFCTSVLAFGTYQMGFDIGALRTLAFVVIVFGNQATMYTNRKRRHLWSSRPSFWVIVSSIADLLIASTLAIGGIAMTPLPAWTVAGTLATAAVFAVMLDLVKVRSIVDLEKHLHGNGTRIIKLFLHLSKEEQRKRFLARIDEPEKNWKFSAADIVERKFWKQHMSAYERCLSATSTRDAPWYVVPADDKENARLIVSRIVLDTFEALKMTYPKTGEAIQSPPLLPA
jgi:hypothetical protein